MNIGFVGLGSMGLPMARRLIKSGHQVCVYNRTCERSEQLRKEGAAIAATPRDVGRNEIVITMLANDRAVEEIVFGIDGLLADPLPGMTHISMSTISLSLSQRLVDAHSETDLGYLSAPVFGRPQAAADGGLTIIAGGNERLIEQCRPIFEILGRKIYAVGNEPSAANVIKLLGNFLIISVVESLGEAFTVVRKSGIDPNQFLEIMTDTLFPSPIYKIYGSLIAQEKYDPPGFKLSLGLKDVELALAAAQSFDVRMPLALLIRDHLHLAIMRGYQDLDLAALALVSAENS